MGPVVSDDAVTRIGGYVERALSSGARLLLEPKPAPSDGSFLSPVIFDRVDPSSELAREEIFGPVLAIVRVDSLEDALRVANASRYGNASSIFTADGGAARTFASRIEVRYGRRQHRRRGPNGVLPFRRHQELDLRRPALSPEEGRGGVLHAAARRDQPLARVAMNEPAALRAGSLTFLEVLATSIALIGPSMTPILIAPYMFANAGNGTWLAYVFGSIMLVFVAFCINQFARRSSAAGSLYGSTFAENLGATVVARSPAWSLLWAYGFVAAATLGAMALFVQILLALGGMHAPAIAIVCALAIVAWHVGVSRRAGFRRS